MAQTSGSQLFSIAYPLFQRISNDDFEYVYRGYFTHNITKKILVLADTNIAKVTYQSTLQKRIYYIMVEGLQNISRHQDEIANANSEQYPGIFAIQKNGERYFISTGNLVANDKIPALQDKLETINALDQEDLKKFHREMLAAGSMSDKGGAGLGLIEMSRKSGNKLIYSFEKIDDQFTYFYLQTLIPGDKSIQGGEVLKAHSSLESVKKLHNRMNLENLMLYFNGFFNQENLLSLLAIIKGRMNMPLTTIKVSNIMVEMLQNIIKHGDKSENTSGGISGVFFLGQTGNEVVLTSGNIIKNDAVAIITERLEFVNSMSKDELSDYYDDILLDFDTQDAKKTGLGFSDLRIKSDRPIKYEFQHIADNDEEQFYILQTAVTIKN